jgi:hypothetical protein
MALPPVLIATIDGTVLGSVNLPASEMPIRPQFTPWPGANVLRVSTRYRRDTGQH